MGSPHRRDGSSGPASGAGGVRADRTLPPQVVRSRDQLFVDADRHGPRAGDVVRRCVPALAALPAALGLAAWTPWRDVLLRSLDPVVADAVLVAPVLVALVSIAAASAPLARCSAATLLLAAAPLLVVTSLVVADGQLVLATVTAIPGALLLGVAAARQLRRAVWALPVLLAAGLSDAQSFQGGITRRLLEDGLSGSASPGGSAARLHVEPILRVPAELVARVDFLVLHVPALTGTWLLGLVDVVALGLLLGLTHLFWLPVARSALALGGALLLVQVTGLALPVLPMLGVAWVLVHARLVWRSTRFSLRRLTYLGG